MNGILICNLFPSPNVINIQNMISGFHDKLPDKRMNFYLTSYDLTLESYILSTFFRYVIKAESSWMEGESSWRPCSVGNIAMAIFEVTDTFFFSLSFILWNLGISLISSSAAHYRKRHSLHHKMCSMRPLYLLSSQKLHSPDNCLLL